MSNLNSHSVLPDRPPRRATAVSQVLRAIRDEIVEGKPGSGMWPVQGANGEASKYRILVASDRPTRERAYALAHQIYKECGYAPEEGRGLCVAPYDAQADTFTLLVEDERGRDVATVTLVFDAPGGLPCDEIFSAELQPLRGSGRRLIEVTRLAMLRELAGSKHLLLQLFNLIYIYAGQVKRRNDFVIEVNPRHVAFYQRLLKFEQLGPERPCSRVRGAPAVLLRLNLSVGHQAIQTAASTQDRTLYKYAYSDHERARAAAFLRENHRPMGQGEASYFGLDGSEERTPLEILAVG